MKALRVYDLSFPLLLSGSSFVLAAICWLVRRIIVGQPLLHIASLSFEGDLLRSQNQAQRCEFVMEVTTFDTAEIN